MAGRDDRPPGEKSRYANQRDVSRGDEELIHARRHDAGPEPEDRVPGTLEDDEDIYRDVEARPASEVTARSETSGSEETEDGLDATEEAVRQQAEDRALGDDRGFRR